MAINNKAGNVPEPVMKLAEKLAKTLGCKVGISQGRNGLHLDLPCPQCLRERGKSELDDMKFSVNASKYLGLGDQHRQAEVANFLPGTEHIKREQKRQRDRSTLCMRTHNHASAKNHRFTVEELLRMRTFAEQFPDLHLRSDAQTMVQTDADKESHWLPDPTTGQLCPPPPGKVTPINQLPLDHAAVQYLLKRRYSMNRLYQQFQVSYCHEEHPHGSNGVYYRGKSNKSKMPKGWVDTPQARIIFYSLHNGTPMNWQARLIEHQDEYHKWNLHPYTLQWELVATRANTASEWIPVSPYDEVKENGALKFKLSKYRNALQAYREIMGLDAARAMKGKQDAPFSYCVLCEGPLDAARVGPGGIAVLGKSMSNDAAMQLTKNFQVIITAFDNDKAGRTATETIRGQLLRNVGRGVTQTVETFPVGAKDLGDMTQASFDEALARLIKQIARSR